MELLPKTKEDFKSADYWDSFFRKRKEAFEWYGEYVDLCEILHKYVKVSDKILMLGCGNSKLSEDLYDVGYHNIVNIDISEIAIKQMTTKNTVQRPGMSYQKMDMLKMDFELESFQVVLDKGTLDAIFPNTENDTLKDIDTMFSEVHRVLKTGGRYICITLAQDHILNKVLESFSSGWFIRVHRVKIHLETGPSDGPKLPAFAFIFTKCLVIGKLRPGENYTLEMFTIDKEEPRYTLTIIDQPHSHAKNGKFAIFIVPQGRETEWLFSCLEGQQQIAASAAFERLVLVCLSRGHQYSSIDAIKQELNGKVMEIAPHGLKKNVQVPYLSAGDDVGSREVIYEGETQFSGKYIIEDVCGDAGIMYRRLIYLNNKTLIQSEARLKTKTEQFKNKGKKKNKSKPKTPSIDYGFISSCYQAMVAGFSMVDHFRTQAKTDVLLIGLGGGSLAMFIHEYFPQVLLETVEIDLDIVNISKQWFGFKEDERLKSHIQDGIEFIQEAAKQGQQFDVMILDIDSKDITRGLSGPPKEFVEPELLKSVKNMIKDGGVLMINLVCRESELRKLVLSNIQNVFQRVWLIDIQEEVNEIVFAQACGHSNSRDESLWMENAKLLEKQITDNFSGEKDEIPELCEILKDVQLVNS